MSFRAIGGGIYADSDLADGEVRVAAPELHMSLATFQRLVDAGAVETVCDVMDARMDGLYTIPTHLVDPELAAEIDAALAFASDEVSATCVLPGCLQDAVDRSRGFSLCAGHAADLGTWDSLAVRVP